MIKTDEIDDLFANDNDITLDEEQKKILAELKSSQGDTSQSNNFQSAPPLMIEDDDVVIKTSENPNKRKSNKNEQRLLEIIKKNKSKGMDDIDKLEEEIMAVEDEHVYDKPLPDANVNSTENGKNSNQDWNDVDSEDVMNVHDSFVKDEDLSNDPNIPSNVPKLDSDAAFNNLNSAYYSNNPQLSKNGNNHSISQNIIRKNYASIDKHKRETLEHKNSDSLFMVSIHSIFMSNQ